MLADLDDDGDQDSADIVAKLNARYQFLLSDSQLEAQKSLIQVN